MSTVSAQKGAKLNQLQRLLPEGLVVDAAWLEAQGYSRGLPPPGWVLKLAPHQRLIFHGAKRLFRTQTIADQAGSLSGSRWSSASATRSSHPAGA